MAASTAACEGELEFLVAGFSSVKYPTIEGAADLVGALAPCTPHPPTAAAVAEAARAREAARAALAIRRN